VEPRVALDELGVHWRHALLAAREAIDDGRLPDEEHRARAHRLRAEIGETEALLAELGRERRARFLPIVVSRTDARQVLGLPANVDAIVADLEGVLIGSTALHIAAWSRAFDEFLSAHDRWELFDPRRDYVPYLHAQSRLAGVRAFLASRGIRLPEGDPGDPPGSATVHGLANRKAALLRQLLDERGVAAFDGSRSYLELAREAGIRCAVVSASANTAAILERAGLAALVDLQVDPAPDALLTACRLLATEPAHAAVFEDAVAGVEAGHDLRFARVVGVAHSVPRDVLLAHGADVAVGELTELLAVA